MTIKRLAGIPVILLVLILLILLSIGCESEPRTLSGNPVKTYEGESFVLTTIFLDEFTLKKRYGRQHNPFINERRIMTPREFFVFDVILKSKGEALSMKREFMRIEYAAISVHPMSRFTLVEHWKSVDEENFEKAMATRKKELLVRKSLFSDNIRVSRGGSIKGLIVFSANFPHYGTATLTIPVFTQGGEILEEVKLDYQYRLY